MKWQYDVGTFRVNAVLEHSPQLVTEQELSKVSCLLHLAWVQLEYGVQSWSSYSKKDVKKSEKVQHRPILSEGLKNLLQETQGLLIFSKQPVRTCQRVLMLQIKIQ